MSIVRGTPRRGRFHAFCAVFFCLMFAVAGLSASTLPEDAPVLISELDSTRALLGGITARRTRALPPGPNTRITLYVTNLELLAGEGRTAFRADIQDAQHFRYPLEIVSFEPAPQYKSVWAITVQLHPGIGDVGDVLIRVTWRGMSSNRVRLSIGHVGGKMPDDEGAEPTPLPSVEKSLARTASRGELPWTGDRVRFMQQAAFGANHTLESRVRRIGYSTWLVEQMEEKRDSNGFLRYSTFPYPKFPLMQTIPAPECDGTSGGGNPIDTDPMCYRNHYTMWPLQLWFFREALYGEDQQLRRRVSWALSQIFVVGGREVVQTPRMVPYIETLDKHAFGNYRNLLSDITLNPGMGTYLDMAISTRQAPNENYAREILQLFSVGVDMLNQDGTPMIQGGNRVPTYDQTTVDGFTKVFTGWSQCNNSNCPNFIPGTVNYLDPMVVNAANHETGAKTLLGGTVLPPGQSASDDLNQALDNIFYHPNVGPFVGKLLIQQLITSNPTPAYVGRVAAAFNNNGSGVRGDMKAVVRAILLDPEARGNFKTDPDYGHLREPVLYATTLLRPNNAIAQAGAPALCNGQSDGAINWLGTLPLDQDVFVPPSVFNYYPMDYIIPGTNLSGPEYGIFSTGTALKRPNFVNLFSPPNSTAAGGVPLVAQPTITQNGAVVPRVDYAPCGTRLDMTRLRDLAVADPSGGQVVDLLNKELMNSSMSAAMRADIMASLSNISSADVPLKRARTALYLVATSSQFQVQR